MSTLRLFVLASVTVSSIALFSCNKDEWEPLFNGETLDGWTVKCIPADRDKEYWKVREGFIECNSLGNPEHNYVWLTSDREFTDFHLKLKYQIFRESGGNSGVQFRSSYDDSENANYGGWLNGPQVDIHAPDPFRNGLIYDETEGVRRWIHPSLPDWRITKEQAPESALLNKLLYFEDDPEAWNSMEIICKGMLVETWVNGNRVTVFDGEGILNDKLHQTQESGETGCIAFQ